MSASSSDLEKSLISLSAQIFQLEQQRKTLVFSSPEEEAEADRALEDLKRRHAATLSSYLELQASRSSSSAVPPSPSPAKTPKAKTGKAIPIVGIVLLLLVIFGNSVSHNSSQGERLKKEDVIQHCVDISEKRLPGAVSYEWDRVKDTFTLFVWDDSFVSAGLAVKAGKDGSAEVWDDLITSLKTVCASMQIKFRDNGYGTTVAVCAVDPSNHDNVLLMVSKNKVLYDATWS
jgi:hypothetical protein